MKALALALLLLPVRSFHAAADISQAPATRPSASIGKVAAVSSGATLAARRGSLSTPLTLEGYFEPAKPFDARIRPKAYGGDLTITAIVANGAKVKKGEVILQLDPKPIDKLLAAAENNDAAAHAALVRARADDAIGRQQEALALRVQTQATQRAEDEVKWFETTDGPNLLRQTQLELENAKASVDDQQDELNELKKMYKGDDLTTDTADIVVKRSVRRLEQSKIGYQMQQDQTRKIETWVYPARKQAVADAAQQADQALALLKDAQTESSVFRQTQMTSAVANTQAVDDHLADLRGDKEKLTVVAPADGVVLYGQLVNGGFQGPDAASLAPGEKIAAQQVVLTFYTPGQLNLHLQVPEAKFFKVQPGAKGTIAPVAFPDVKFAGTCDCAAPEAINTPQGPQYHLIVACDRVDPRLAPGMRAEFHIDLGEPGKYVVVPSSAVSDGCVWVKSDDGVQKRPVIVGKSDGKMTQIKSGLGEGEKVLIEAQK